MARQKLLTLFDQDQRKNIEFPGMRREVTPHVVRLIDNSDLGEGMIVFSQLDESNADDVIREQIAHFQNVGQDFEWKVYDYDLPSDLKERLVSFGFTIGEVEAIMVLDLEDAPEIFWQPVQHDIRRITDPDKLTDVEYVEGQVWEEDASWVYSLLGGALNDYPDQMSVYVAYVDDQPASAAWIYFPKNSRFASLWGGATISRYRKQGLFTALLAARAQEAISRQVRYLIVDAFPMSRPILEKLGFKIIAYSYPCKWEVSHLE